MPLKPTASFYLEDATILEEDQVLEDVTTDFFAVRVDTSELDVCFADLPVAVDKGFFAAVVEVVELLEVVEVVVGLVELVAIEGS
jgi:hypothetical protein